MSEMAEADVSLRETMARQSVSKRPWRWGRKGRAGCLPPLPLICTASVCGVECVVACVMRDVADGRVGDFVWVHREDEEVGGAVAGEAPTPRPTCNA